MDWIGILLFFVCFEILSVRGEKPFFALPVVFGLAVFSVANLSDVTAFENAHGLGMSWALHHFFLSVKGDAVVSLLFIGAVYLASVTVCWLILRLAFDTRAQLLISIGLVFQLVVEQWMIDPDNALTKGDEGVPARLGNYPELVTAEFASLVVLIGLAGLILRLLFWKSDIGKSLEFISKDLALSASIGIRQSPVFLKTSLVAGAVLCLAVLLMVGDTGRLLPGTFGIHLSLFATLVALIARKSSYYFVLAAGLIICSGPLLGLINGFGSVALMVANIGLGVAVIVYAILGKQNWRS